MYCCRGSMEEKKKCEKKRQEYELPFVFLVVSWSPVLSLVGWVSSVFTQSHVMQGSALFSPPLPSSGRIVYQSLYY